MLDLGENIGFSKKFRFGRKFKVRARILCLGNFFRFGREFWVGAKILGSGENF